MRKILISFLIGALVGAIVVASVLLYNKEQAASLPALEILDDVIRAWSLPDDTAAIFVAGFGDKKSDFKIGIFPDSIRAYAARVESLYKIPRGVTLCQWALESRWGLADLGAKNCFGLTLAAVRKYMSHPSYVVRMDLVSTKGHLARKRPVRFAKFESVEQCFLTYGKYLAASPLYADAFRTHSPRKFIRVIAKRYAQDSQYAVKLITIMRRYNLE
jgi:flagellum-specific peptidoglycan hydrolase FlgJ